MKVLQFLSLFAIAIASPVSTKSNVDVLTYDGYKLQYSCSKVTANRWTYTLSANNKGSSARPREYELDPNYPAECQQISGDAYGQGYDRGHLYPIIHVMCYTRQKNEKSALIGNTCSLYQKGFFYSSAKTHILNVQTVRKYAILMVVESGLDGLKTV
ncbi:hypothetical protein BC833DRAFT_568524 [Globomyces pollinis-pini]|nr:hypothetical protein BC833DRAFT_568524 [Globomyces pollinis-pini]